VNDYISLLSPYTECREINFMSVFRHILIMVVSLFAWIMLTALSWDLSALNFTVSCVLI